MQCPHCKKRFNSHPVKSSPRRDQILPLLTGEGLTAREVAAKVRLKPKTVGRLLNAYEKAGMVQRNGHKAVLQTCFGDRPMTYRVTLWVRS
jgi:Fe2+ or Zn2+ uptake regulation protein